MLTSLVLPDGSQYTFTYDTGNTPTHLGDLVGITLPTGGQVSFTYPVTPQPIGPYLTSATFGGGTWTFTYGSTTTMLSPSRYDAASNTNVSDKTVFTPVFGDPHLATVQYYSGSSDLLP